jgi:hypothetical protein
MKRLAALGLALVLLGSMASAQLIEGPRRNPPRPVSNPSSSGSFGIGVNLDFSKSPPVAPPLEMRDADIPERLEDQVIFVIAGTGAGTAADASRIAGQARVSLIEFTQLEALGKAMVVARLAPGDTVDAAMPRWRASGQSGAHSGRSRISSSSRLAPRCRSDSV